MLKVPRVGGAAQLRLFIDDLGFTWACKAIQVHPTTMRRWLRDETPVPAAPLQALYWLSKWGYSDACGEAHWTHQFMIGKVMQLKARVEWEAPRHWSAANEARYHAPGLLVPLSTA